MKLHKIKNCLSRILSFFKRTQRGGNMVKRDKNESQDKTQSKETRKDKWKPHLKTKFSSRFDWKKLLK